MEEIKFTTQTFGEILDRLFAESGKTVPKICEKAGVCYTTVKEWMNGRNGPTLMSLELVLDALGKELVIREKVSGDG